MKAWALQMAYQQLRQRCGTSSPDTRPVLCFRINTPKANRRTLIRPMASTDWTRSDTPGTSTAAHFNAAGASLPTLQSLDAAKTFLDAEAAIGGYEAVEDFHDALRKPYHGLAELINCNPDEIAIVQSATSAWQQVFFGLPFEHSDRILTSMQEYATNYISFLQMRTRTGVQIEVVPETEDGEIDAAALERMILQPPKPKLVAVSHIATNSGRVYDAAAVGAVTHKHGVPYLLDACQSVGQVPLDVQMDRPSHGQSQEIKCDWLSGTARKYLRGLRGVGFLYASRKAMAETEPAQLDLHGAKWTLREAYEMQPDATRYEQYEISNAAKVAFGVAVQQALDIGMQPIWQRIQHLADRLRQGLREVPGVTVHDRGRVLCGIVSWSKEGCDPAEARVRLRRDFGMHVWASPRASTLLDMQARGLQAVIRSSVHYYNSEKEVDRLIAAAEEL